MRGVRYTFSAENDIEEIGDRIFERNPRRALTFIAGLRDQCSRLADNPFIGMAKPEWGGGLRRTIHGNYVIVYRVDEEDVTVIRVVHGGRDIEKLFDE